jgi:hypothetical protein
MLRTFKLGKKRTGTNKGVFRKAEKLRDTQEQPPFYIRGIKAGSKEEFWVSLALDKIQKAEGYAWEYQVPIYGGRDIAGGLVIDFVVYTPGRRTWISPMGRYWHTGIHEDRMQEINAALKKGVNLIAFFTDEISSKDDTYTFIKRKLNL